MTNRLVGPTKGCNASAQRSEKGKLKIRTCFNGARCGRHLPGSRGTARPGRPARMRVGIYQLKIRSRSSQNAPTATQQLFASAPKVGGPHGHAQLRRHRGKYWRSRACMHAFGLVHAVPPPSRPPARRGGHPSHLGLMRRTKSRRGTKAPSEHFQRRLASRLQASDGRSGV